VWQSASRVNVAGADGVPPAEGQELDGGPGAMPPRLRAHRARAMYPPVAPAGPLDNGGDVEDPASRRSSARAAAPPQRMAPLTAQPASSTPPADRLTPARLVEASLGAPETSRARQAGFPRLIERPYLAHSAGTAGRVRQRTRAVEEWDGVANAWEPSQAWSSPIGVFFPETIQPPDAVDPFRVTRLWPEIVPGDLDGGFGFRCEGPEDPWPALPEVRPDEVEDGTALLRAWERQRRLDREQRGAGWNELPS
jgi:hypothetical protein